jgi:hypothetical protein
VADLTVPWPILLEYKDDIRVLTIGKGMLAIAA